MKHRLMRFVLFALLMASSVEVRAQNSLQHARILFDAGVQAYTAGRYNEAAESFKEAYALSGKPQAVFSLAQAERRLHLVTNESRHLRSSVEHFRKYLELVPEGGRRNDAVEALEQLELLVLRETTTGETKDGMQDAVIGKVLISTTTPGAKISIDGGKEAESPLLEAVSPGKHIVNVTAPGHIPEKREIIAVENALVPLEMNLREEPAYLTIATHAHAYVQIDGQGHGEARVGEKIELRSGLHTVAISLAGHYPRRENIRLTAGKTNSIEIPLDQTRQRTASYVLLGVTGAGVIGAGIQALMILNEQSSARAIMQQTQSGNITQTQLDDYNARITNIEQLSKSAPITMVGASVLGIAGALLYSFEPQKGATNDVSPRNAIGISAVAGPSHAGLRITGLW